MLIIDFIKDTISPKKCYSCEKEGYFFCPDCVSKIRPYTPFCYICKEESNKFQIHTKCQLASSLSQIIVYGKYSDRYLKKLIHDGKYYGKKEIYKDLAKPLSDLFLKNHTITNTSDYIIIGTPMYFFRRWKRGYNQSNILAECIGKYVGVDFYKDVIKKRKGTSPQSHLTRDERMVNLKKSLVINPKYKNFIKGKNAIVVDDVISTGSTLGEVSGLLKLFGVKNVIGLVIASD